MTRRLTHDELVEIERRNRKEQEAWEAALPGLLAAAQAKIERAYKARRGCQLTADEVMALAKGTRADAYFFCERQRSKQVAAEYSKRAAA